MDYFEVARKATNFDILSSLCQGNTNFIEIGCFAKALTQGIFATMYGLPKDEDKIIFLDYCGISVGRDQDGCNRIVNQWGDHEYSFYYLKNYGKTWAFTEEELRGTNDTTSRN